jgi:hypothetical protein
MFEEAAHLSPAGRSSLSEAASGLEKLEAAYVDEDLECGGWMRVSWKLDDKEGQVTLRGKQVAEVDQVFQVLNRELPTDPIPLTGEP